VSLFAGHAEGGVGDAAVLHVGGQLAERQVRRFGPGGAGPALETGGALELLAALDDRGLEFSSSSWRMASAAPPRDSAIR
jgi:hypothetical protein